MRSMSSPVGTDSTSADRPASAGTVISKESMEADANASPGPTLDESLEFPSRFIAWAYARGRRTDEKRLSD